MKKSLQVVMILMIFLVAAGSLCTRTEIIGHSEMYYVPVRPSIQFERFGVNCISDEQRERLVKWIIAAERALRKYETQASILNEPN